MRNLTANHIFWRADILHKAAAAAAPPPPALAWVVSLSKGLSCVGRTRCSSSSSISFPSPPFSSSSSSLFWRHGSDWRPNSSSSNRDSNCGRQRSGFDSSSCSRYDDGKKLWGSSKGGDSSSSRGCVCFTGNRHNLCISLLPGCFRHYYHCSSSSSNSSSSSSKKKGGAGLSRSRGCVNVWGVACIVNFERRCSRLCMSFSLPSFPVSAAAAASRQPWRLCELTAFSVSHSSSAAFLHSASAAASPFSSPGPAGTESAAASQPGAPLPPPSHSPSPQPHPDIAAAAAPSAAAVKHLLPLHPGETLHVAGVPLRSTSAAEVEALLQKKLKEESRLKRRMMVVLLLLGSGMYCCFALGNVSSMPYTLYGPCASILFRLFDRGLLEPEAAHRLAVGLASRGYLPADYDKDWPAMAVDLQGLHFPNPIGLAAGFDKNAEAALPLLRMGFGFVEVGSITPEPQAGNPRPRIFRLPFDRAIINRCGFNSKGAEYAEQQLQQTAARRWIDPLASTGVIGVNIGKNKTGDAVADVKAGINKLARYADFLVINLSSPNTPGLRLLQQKQHLAELVDAAQQQLHALDQQQQKQELAAAADNTAAAGAAAEKGDEEKGEEEKKKKKPSHVFGRGSAKTAAAAAAGASPGQEGEDFYLTQTRRRPLLFIKIAPDLTMEEKKDIADVVLEKKVDGLVVTNTTVQRPSTLRSSSRNEVGGLSGPPLKSLSTQCVYDMYQLTGGKVFIIAAGGVECGRDALDKIEAGASLVEIYTSLIYKGPQVVRQIKNELYGLLNAKGYHSISQAVGARHRATPQRKVSAPRFD